MKNRFGVPFGAASRRTVLKSLAAGVGVAALGGGWTGAAFAEDRTLTINTNISGEGQRKLMAQFIEEFTKETGIKVQQNAMDHEGYKTAIRNFLVANPPDVCLWFSGDRMRAFVNRGLFDDMSDLWAKEGWADKVGALTTTVTVDGKQYGVPTGASFWGIWARKDYLDKYAGGKAPATWDELVAYGDKMVADGISPFAIGTKDLWPSAAWFDYLNLRINGYDFHMQLMAGEASYEDPKLDAVFDKWQELIDKKFFIPNHTSYDWQGAVPFLLQGKAGMYLMGQFLTRNIPAADLDKYTYLQFPVIDAAVPTAEEFPVDSMHIPSGAKNKDLARQFITFFYQPQRLALWVEPEGNIPTRSDVPVLKKDWLLEKGQEILKSAKSASQYYDRDTDPDMAQIGMNGFQQFMADPNSRKAVQARLEQARKRIYKKS
ncbi:ABC transporter substrate-binding protein [Kaistia terrae]|uniref:ABC transporter substrate-binding protein n=1 Tax=Kaistia terrae TaxID=537017 RepID=A0ABW0PV68_9HYPH|nr:extracellular solute-binding protein [Kaistia terrae]MCX5576921.1 extracellular solute-binding protein [Kaistia terrae]